MYRQPDPRDQDDQDVVRDALALIQCAHADDWEGGYVILANCRPAQVAAFLARVCADVIESMTVDADAALAWLREHHAG
jgi:hypothetical protein